MVILCKTKALIVIGSKNSLTYLHFYYQAKEIEITTTYTYLGIQFMRLHFFLRQTLQPQLSKKVLLPGPLQETLINFHTLIHF